MGRKRPSDRFLVAAAMVVSVLLGWHWLTRPIAGYRVYEVTSRSMYPTARLGERVVVNLEYYRDHQLQRGDVVMIHRDRQDILILTRLIALPGDVVEVSDLATTVNGQVVAEPYVVHGNGGRLGTLSLGPLTIPDGQMFVMGDNRDVAYDSRYPEFEPASADDVMGRASVIFWSDERGRIGKEIK